MCLLPSSHWINAVRPAWLCDEQDHNLVLGIKIMVELFAFPLIAQLCLAFGMAGLLWPEKVKGCTVLWFPWIPTYRAVRYSSIGAIVFSMLVVALFLSRLNPGSLP